MTQVVVAEMSENSTRDLSTEAAVLGPDVDLVYFAYTGDDAELIAACSGADAVLTDYVPFDRSTIAALTNCRLISVAATGYSTIDVDAAKKAGISVCAIGEYCTDEVADHVMLLMLALCRRFLDYHHQVQTERRWQFDSLDGLRRLSELTLGIVGLGRIGQAVAKRALAFGMTVNAFDPYLGGDVTNQLNVSLQDLDEILACSDVISLNCDLTENNRDMLNSTAFAAMQRKPVLINCARGGLIDEKALIAALETGQIAAAGLDVLSDESPDLEVSRLRGRANVILTPHVAFYSDASIADNRRISARNIDEFLRGNHSNVDRYIHHSHAGKLR